MEYKTRKVWRIFHYTERFEPKTASRHFFESSLDFTKDYVFDGGSDEGASYQRQFALLSNDDGLENCTLYGCYRLLINLASQSSRAFRGYLLGADKTPLSDAQIAKLFHISTPEMKRMLRRFASVKLLERVELPEFDLSLNDGGEGNKNEKAAEQRKKKAGKTRGRKFTKRNQAQASVGVRAPLTKDKGKVKDKENQKATSGLSASGLEGKENGNGKEESLKAEKQNQCRTTIPPATSPSMSSREPTVTDALGASKVIPFESPPGADYSRAGLVYGRKVYLALNLPWDIDGPQTARETEVRHHERGKIEKTLFLRHEGGV